MFVNCFQSFAVLVSKVLIGKSTRFDLTIQIISFLDVARKDRHSLKVETEALCKEFLDAHHVSCKIVLRIRVASGCHLWEIDDGDLLIIVDK